MDISLTIALVLYLLSLFLVIFFLRQKRPITSNMEFLQEYITGSRNINGIALGISLVSSYASASTFIGGTGASYKMGLGWVLIAMIQIPVAWLILSIIGKKLAIEARLCQAVTLNDILFHRYRSHSIVILSSSTIVLTLITAMIVQFVAAARLLQVITGLSFLHGLFIFTIVISVYTSIGGFRTVVITDVLQGILMVIGAVVLLFGVIFYGGGVETMITKLHQIDPGLISPHGPDNYLDHYFMFSFWILICFGTIALPYTTMHCISFSDSRSLHNAIIVSTIIITIIMFCTTLAGALGRACIPGLDNPDLIIPNLMVTTLPPILSGVFLAALLAAIMSTVDSQLIQTAATILKDLYLNYINPGQLQDHTSTLNISLISRIITICLTVIIFFGSLHPPDMIIWLNLLYFGALQSVFLWPIILGLYWKKASATGAIASMAVGLSCYLYISISPPYSIKLHAVVPSLVIALIAFIAGSLIKPR